MKHLAFLFLCLFLTINLFAQVGINTDNSDPDASAMLDVKSTSKGVLIPRMSSTERQQILAPAVGLMVYDSTAQAFYYFNGMGWLELLSGSATVLEDADSDTKIQVEENADEDIIRVDVAGNEYLRIRDGGIDIIDNANIFLGEDSGSDNIGSTARNNIGIGTTALDSVTTGNDNVAVGQEALMTNKTGMNNVAIGYQSLKKSTNSQSNIGIGRQALFNNTLGRDNTALGNLALYTNTEGQHNTAIGNFSLWKNTSGSYNVGIGNFSLGANTEGGDNIGIGNNALMQNTEGDFNIALGEDALIDNTIGIANISIGKSAGQNNRTGHNNLFIGREAGQNGDTDGTGNIFLGYQAGKNQSGSNKLAIDNSDTASPLLYGEFDTDLLRVNGTLNINNSFSFPTMDGTANQILQTDGNGNISWATVSSVSSTQALIQDVDNDTKIQVEESADEDVIRFDLEGKELMRLEGRRLEISNTGGSVYIGKNVGINNTFFDSDNVGIGQNVLANVIAGYKNIGIGTGALMENEVGRNNIAIGDSTLARNLADGNIAIGDEALKSNTGGTGNLGVGNFSLLANTTGEDNIAIGDNSLNQNTRGNENIAIGEDALNQNVTGSDNIAIGDNAGLGNVKGRRNIFIGESARATGDSLINAAAIGYLAEVSQDSSIILGNAAKVGIGTSAPDEKLHVVGNVKIEDGNAQAGYILTSDANGVGTWQQNLGTNSVPTIIQDADTDTKIQVEESADEDVIRFDIGGAEVFRILKNTNGFPLFVPTSAMNSTAFGSLSGANLSTGENNAFFGRLAGRLTTTGENNTFVGNSAGAFTDLGSNNVFLGTGTGNNNKSGSGNVFLGFNAGLGELSSNKLYIENSSSNSPLIYGEFDNNLLRVNGTLNINNAFSFPTVDGTNGQMLTTDGSGTLSWTSFPTTNFIENRTSDNSEVGGQSANIDVQGTIETNGLRTNGNVTLGSSTDPSPNTVTVNSNLAVNSSLKVGTNGATIAGILKHSETRDISSIGGNSSRIETFTVTGATTDGVVYVSTSDQLQSQIVIAQAWVSAANTVSVRFRNTDGGSQNPDGNGMTYRIVVIQ